MIEDFARHSPSALLRRKAQALTVDRLFDFSKEEENTGTVDISVEGIHRDRVGVVPAAKGYFGLYDRRGGFYGLLKMGARQYTRNELIEPHEMDILKLSDEMNPAERQRRMQAQRDYLMLLDRSIVEGIKQDFGFSLSDLTLREQLWFIASLRNVSSAEEGRIQEFTHLFGLDGARAFLSVESGDKWRDHVLGLAEHLPTETTKRVLHRFSEIAEIVQSNIHEMIQPLLSDGAQSAVDEISLERILLSRARALLLNADNPGADIEQIEKMLSKQSTDVILFSSVFKSLFKGETKVDFSRLNGLEFGTYQGDELAEADRAQMLEIAKENWNHTPDLAAFVIGKTKGLLDTKSEKQQFYILKKNGAIAAFLRFEDREDLEPGAIYGGSFNVSSELRGSAIGEAMLHQVLDQLAKDHVIYADVFPEVLAGTAYVEKFGCVITGVESVNLDGKQMKRFLLRRDDRENDEYLARKKDASAESLSQMAGVRVESFDIRTQKEQMISAIAEATRKGNVVTRYWYDQQDPNKRFFAIEKSLPAVYELRVAA